ncbi:MAG TPA: hypothetical protein PK351_07960 [Spirochaetota bacterium]|nr:hypothetical protein [Spirochaetota bacterium]HPP04742.1 hypothetical protein [Spirochaetota bacterium]
MSTKSKNKLEIKFNIKKQIITAIIIITSGIVLELIIALISQLFRK